MGALNATYVEIAWGKLGEPHMAFYGRGAANLKPRIYWKEIFMGERKNFPILHL